MLNSSAFMILLLLMAVTSSAHEIMRRQTKKTHQNMESGVIVHAPMFKARRTADQVAHYCRNIGVFGNKQDAPVAARLYRSFIENQEHSVFFAVGVADGSTIKDLFAQPWWDKTKVKVFGWEAMNESYTKAAEKLHGHEEVELFHKGVSDKDAELELSGNGELSGFYAPGPHGLKDAHEKATTLRWDEFVKSRDIPQVAYALIDTEGHEMSVIHGMNLEKLKTTFPIFQYELGGTWIDGRHAGNMTQGDAAKYLESLGYSIFLMGVSAGGPILAQMTPEAFPAVHCLQENGKFMVQGNALAVLEEDILKKPWLKDVISEMLQRDRDRGF